MNQTTNHTSLTQAENEIPPRDEAVDELRRLESYLHGLIDGYEKERDKRETPGNTPQDWGYWKYEGCRQAAETVRGRVGCMIRARVRCNGGYAG